VVKLYPAKYLVIEGPASNIGGKITRVYKEATLQIQEDIITYKQLI